MDLDKVPLVMCGDMNSKTDSSVLHYIMNQKFDLEQEGEAIKKNPIAYQD